MYGGLSGLAVSNGVEGPVSGAAPPRRRWTTRVTLPHGTRCIGGDMHCDHSRDVEGVATFKTHPSLMSESSPEMSYGKFGDLE